MMRPLRSAIHERAIWRQTTRQADLLIVAIGRPGFIGREHIKPGATVIDVGMNQVTDEAKARRLFGDEAEARIDRSSAKRGYTLVGDVNPAEADEVAGSARRYREVWDC